MRSPTTNTTHLSPQPQIFRLVGLLSLSIACALGCAQGAGECPLAGECESSITVSYGMAVVGPYNLVIDPSGEFTTARCNAPEELDPIENPAWLTCTATGFEVTGERADVGSWINVTIESDQGGVIVANEEVGLLAAVIEPNGPECPPFCYARTGQLIGSS